MSHVGRRYDLAVGGRPLRIVVVGQESGLPKGAGAHGRERRVSLETRYEAIHDVSGLQRRYRAGSGYSGRNPHMRGTTQALRVVFGKGLGTSHEDEFVTPTKGRSFHLFDGFALVNRLLCSAGPCGGSEGHPTSTMFANCVEHFIATLRILEPTLVIVQGKRVERRTCDVFKLHRSLSDHLHEARFEGRKILLCAFSHPSAHGSLRWGDSLEAPYLTQVVVPTLEDAVGRL